MVSYTRNDDLKRYFIVFEAADRKSVIEFRENLRLKLPDFFRANWLGFEASTPSIQEKAKGFIQQAKSALRGAL